MDYQDVSEVIDLLCYLLASKAHIHFCDYGVNSGLYPCIGWSIGIRSIAIQN
jgi:hypothetical protein